MAEPRVLKLQSPAYGEPVYYKWPLVISKRLDEASEIVDNIRMVCEDFPELKYAVENVMLKDYDPTDFETMNQLCQRYNKAIRNILSLWKGRAPPPRMFKPPSKDLLRHIINLCYSHAIKEPEKLNQYEPFSPEVYGETSFDMVARILEEVQKNKEERFVDLGSGVGQVVLQAAASNQFKECYGVEKADTPAMFAKQMEKEFKKWMDWFGKIYTDFTLEKGDFLEEKWKDIINDCGVVFVNNFAFGPVVNHHLKSRFQSMKEGSKIISSREFCPTNFKFNKRNLSELGAMMKVTEIKPRSEEASVSWTGNIVSYYLHVVDRTRLEKYFSILKKRKEGQELDEDEMSLYSESNYSVDTSGAAVDHETLEDNLDDLYLGTTTRHQWQLLTDTIKQSKQDAICPTKNAKHGQEKKLQRPAGAKKTGKIDLKNKILRKYGQQALKKAKQAALEEDEEQYKEEKNDEVVEVPKKKRGRPSLQKPHEMTTDKQTSVEKKIPSSRQSHHKEHGNNDDLDKFLAGMKVKYLEFIKRMNTKEYADRLKLMIECERAKKKLLQRKTNEMERTVHNLISDGLKRFSSCLDELDVAVKTPLELLSKSSALAERRQVLENKVMSMEIEVYNLEEKHRSLCAVRDEKNRRCGLQPLLDSDEDEVLNPDNSSQLPTKLCSAILNALNHRRKLIDKESSLSEQISILEKIHHPKSRDDPSKVGTVEENEPSKSKPDMPRSKPRPVAFVPPRMLSQDKKNSLSPDTSMNFAGPEASNDASTTPTSADPVRRPRGRPRKRPKVVDELSTQSDSSQDNKDSEADERPSLRPPVPDERTPRISTTNQTPDGQAELLSSNQFFMFNTREERAPIVFPKLDKSRQDTTQDFLKSSSKLLSSFVDQWPPVDKLFEPRSTNTKGRHDDSANQISKYPLPSVDWLYEQETKMETTPGKHPLESSYNDKQDFSSRDSDTNSHVVSSSQHNIYDNLQFAYLRQLSKDESKKNTPGNVTGNLANTCYANTSSRKVAAEKLVIDGMASVLQNKRLAYYPTTLAAVDASITTKGQSECPVIRTSSSCSPFHNSSLSYDAITKRSKESPPSYSNSHPNCREVVKGTIGDNVVGSKLKGSVKKTTRNKTATHEKKSTHDITSRQSPSATHPYFLGIAIDNTSDFYHHQPPPTDQIMLSRLSTSASTSCIVSNFQSRNGAPEPSSFLNSSRYMFPMGKVITPVISSTSANKTVCSEAVRSDYSVHTDEKQSLKIEPPVNNVHYPQNLLFDQKYLNLFPHERKCTTIVSHSKDDKNGGPNTRNITPLYCPSSLKLLKDRENRGFTGQKTTVEAADDTAVGMYDPSTGSIVSKSPRKTEGQLHQQVEISNLLVSHHYGSHNLPPPKIPGGHTPYLPTLKREPPTQVNIPSVLFPIHSDTSKPIYMPLSKPISTYNTGPPPIKKSKLSNPPISKVESSEMKKTLVNNASLPGAFLFTSSTNNSKQFVSTILPSSKNNLKHSSPIILSKSALHYTTNTLIQPQVVNLIQPLSSVATVILPKTISHTTGPLQRPLFTQPISSHLGAFPSQPRLLLPSVKDTSSNDGKEKNGKSERILSMTSPTYPPPRIDYSRKKTR